MYKLTKGTLSLVRNTKKEIDVLTEQGYTLDGECNDKYEIIDANPIFKTRKPAKNQQED